MLLDPLCACSTENLDQHKNFWSCRSTLRLCEHVAGCSKAPDLTLHAKVAFRLSAIVWVIHHGPLYEEGETLTRLRPTLPVDVLASPSKPYECSVKDVELFIYRETSSIRCTLSLTPLVTRFTSPGAGR